MKGYEGNKQGDMSPDVEDYQKPMSDYSQADSNKTLEYIRRQDRIQKEMADDIKKQSYKGRYS